MIYPKDVNSGDKITVIFSAVPRNIVKHNRVISVGKTPQNDEYITCHDGTNTNHITYHKMDDGTILVTYKSSTALAGTQTVTDVQIDD
jgi:hypothetical protein